MRVYSPSKNHSISFLFAQFTIVCISILMTSSKHSAVVGLASKSVSAAVQKASASTTNNVYYWFRLGDLRLHDNPGFNRAVADYCCAANTQPKNLIPVFCFDPRIFGGGGGGGGKQDADHHAAPRTEVSGRIKTCPRRAQFVIDSVTDLRQTLQHHGSTLLVPTNSKQTPEQFFQELLGGGNTNDHNTLIYQEEVCSEEQRVASNVAKLFSSSEAVWGSTVRSNSHTKNRHGVFSSLFLILYDYLLTCHAICAFFSFLFACVVLLLPLLLLLLQRCTTWTIYRTTCRNWIIYRIHLHRSEIK